LFIFRLFSIIIIKQQRDKMICADRYLYGADPYGKTKFEKGSILDEIFTKISNYIPELVKPIFDLLNKVENTSNQQPTAFLDSGVSDDYSDSDLSAGEVSDSGNQPTDLLLLFSNVRDDAGSRSSGEFSDDAGSRSSGEVSDDDSDSQGEVTDQSSGEVVENTSNQQPTASLDSGVSDDYSDSDLSAGEVTHQTSGEVSDSGNQPTDLLLLFSNVRDDAGSQSSGKVIDDAGSRSSGEVSDDDSDSQGEVTDQSSGEVSDDAGSQSSGEVSDDAGSQSS
jgi:hypothetical protein